MKNYIISIIMFAICLFLAGCVSSKSDARKRAARGDPVEFVPLAVERVIPFDGEDPQSARLEISLVLSEPADSMAGVGQLVRELLYEGQSAADYGEAVIAEHEEFYTALRAEWISQGGARLDSFNWYYTEEVESRVFAEDFIPGRENLLVLTKTTESYLGGAHGNYVTNCFVIDTAAGKRLLLDDIFSSREELRLLLEAELRRRYQLPEDAPLSAAGFFEDAIEPPENFFPADDASDGAGDASPVMRFLWNAYEIAPYVMGAIEVSLPLKSLSPLFRQ
jgi:hypothetical protein